MNDFRFCLSLTDRIMPSWTKWLAEVGVYALFGSTDLITADLAQACHDNGIKVFVEWPHWRELQLTGEDVSFRNYRGEVPTDYYGDLNSPTYWHPLANEMAGSLLEKVGDLKADGLLIMPRYSDNPFPKDWDRVDEDDFLHNAQYWSFDQWAQQDWRDRYESPMPSHASLEGDDTFYQWYQAAWFGRLKGLTQTALEAGYTDLHTWFAPMPSRTLENLALGTFNQNWLYDQWAAQVLASGGNATMVAACFFSSYLPQRATNIAATLHDVKANGWSMMVGGELCYSVESVLSALVCNGTYAKRNGLSLFGSARHIFAPAIRRPVTAILKELNEVS